MTSMHTSLTFFYLFFLFLKMKCPRSSSVVAVVALRGKMRTSAVFKRDVSLHSADLEVK